MQCLCETFLFWLGNFTGFEWYPNPSKSGVGYCYLKSRRTNTKHLVLRGYSNLLNIIERYDFSPFAKKVNSTDNKNGLSFIYFCFNDYSNCIRERRTFVNLLQKSLDPEARYKKFVNEAFHIALQTYANLYQAAMQ